MQYVKGISKADHESMQTTLPEMASLGRFAEAPVTKADMDALVAFLDRTYFTRVYIVQELVTSKEGLVICGRHTLAMKAVEEASNNLSGSLWRAIINDLDNILNSCLVPICGLESWSA